MQTLEMLLIGLIFLIPFYLALALPLAYHYGDRKTVRKIVGIFGNVLMAVVGVADILAKLLEWLKSNLGK